MYPNTLPKFLFFLCQLFIFLFVFTQNCVLSQNSKIRNKEVILNYQDFGPQVIAYKLIGYEYYQWNSQGADDPNQKDDIKVVIYRGTTLTKIKNKYPVIKDKQDFRYVEYQKALNFISNNLTLWKKEKLLEKNSQMVTTYNNLIEQYKQTQSKIIAGLNQ